MGKRTGYAPGTFSWVELSTSDAGAAKAFYGGLFGWEPRDAPIPGGGSYTMLHVGEDTVAALYEAQTGQPPAWLSYVTVEDADAAAARAKELGATLITEPFDVMTVGRMAIIQDPVGAVFAVWQARESIGATRVNDPGCLTWNDLGTPDMAASADFYSELFGWRVEGVEEYQQIYVGDRSNGGIRPLQQGEPVPWWGPYFTVGDLEASAERAGELGGEVLVPPFEVSPGRRFATVRDPQGAVFSLYAGDIDD